MFTMFSSNSYNKFTELFIKLFLAGFSQFFCFHFWSWVFLFFWSWINSSIGFPRDTNHPFKIIFSEMCIGMTPLEMNKTNYNHQVISHWWLLLRRFHKSFRCFNHLFKVLSWAFQSLKISTQTAMFGQGDHYSIHTIVQFPHTLIVI